ncbi:MAG: cysteine desulfurase family protein [Anaerolineales bacterium]|nr:cysteine desulfurase family protein [Anaerolineales bacterium]
MEPIYLDYAATTPLDPRVLEAMLPYLREEFGNPSSVHSFGRRAEKAVEGARRTVADVLGCDPDEIIFTGGGSESNNLALRGAAFAARELRGANHLITAPTEHEAVLATMHQLRDHFGFELTELPVDRTGRVEPAEVARALRPDTALVSVMTANNEIGTLQPIAEIAAICREHGVLFHTDAVQAAGQLDLNVRASGVDLLSLGAHKFYGPKGVGALYVRRGTPLLPTQTGGAQERGRRAGTSNVASIVGLAEALRITAQERETHNARFAALREYIIAGVLSNVPESRVTGHRLERLPNHASFVFRHVNGNDLLMHLDLAGIAASSGSACKTGDPRPSGVLLALGLEPEWALGSLRITVGRGTTEAHVERLVAVLPKVVEKLRAERVALA